MSTYKDRVRETSTTTGTSDLTTAGAVTGFITFNTAFGTNVLFDYMIEAVDANNIPTGDWEVGRGYLSAATTLVRTVPRAGSAAVPVNFAAGTKIIVCTIAAEQVIGRGRRVATAMQLYLP
jgi:hypothetical protein